MPSADSAGTALCQGLLVGAGFVATTMWLIDGGYHTIQFAIHGLIIGLWH